MQAENCNRFFSTAKNAAKVAIVHLQMKVYNHSIYKKKRVQKNTFASMHRYPSKLLLFGEHVLLLGATALALPLNKFGGKWVENAKDQDPEIQQKLLQFAESEHLHQVEALEVRAFVQDVQKGLVFESNIPIGYGLGSSGALCAAVYDRYCRVKTNDLLELKTIFAGMESFFHGASSGIDPLTSYIEKPILIRNTSEVTVAETSAWQEPPVVFLIDSGLPRQTGTLVRWFLERAKESSFADKMALEYLPAHEALIQSWIAADADAFWPNLQRISTFQFDNFVPMIPETLREIWVENLESNQITLKICGAGGGGFMLGFCRNAEAVQVLVKHFNLVFPFST